jgi:hypothetical protein
MARWLVVALVVLLALIVLLFVLGTVTSTEGEAGAATTALHRA